MHMAFLSRVFKNLQWYGMTKREAKKDIGCKSPVFSRLPRPVDE